VIDRVVLDARGASASTARMIRENVMVTGDGLRDITDGSFGRGSVHTRSTAHPASKSTQKPIGIVPGSDSLSAVSTAMTVTVCSST